MDRQTEQQFLKLTEQHKGILHKVSRIYAESLQDREDLRQEILIQLWKSYGTFRAESGFATWMYRVAVNTAITYFKKEQQYSSRHSDTIIPEKLSQDAPDAAEGQLRIFYKAVLHLNPIEKAIIFYFMEGLSHREIAGNLGLTEGNARVKLNRIKEKIQYIIKQNGYEL